MAEGHASANAETEVQDRGVFDFLKKDEDKKPEHGTLANELEKAKISDSEDEKKPTLLEKLHRSDSSSSLSSIQEELEVGGEKITSKKKGRELEEKIKKNLPGGHKKPEESAAPIAPSPVNTEPKEKKGILEKIKEILPGYHRDTIDPH